MEAKDKSVIEIILEVGIADDVEIEDLDWDELTEIHAYLHLLRTKLNEVIRSKSNEVIRTK